MGVKEEQVPALCRITNLSKYNFNPSEEDMKKWRRYIRSLAVISSVLMLSTAAMALNLQNGELVGGTGIVGTYHDLSTTGVGSYYGITEKHNRICVFCHAPHNTLLPATALTKAGGINYVPLWNHGDGSGNVTLATTWTMYGHGNVSIGDPNDPNSNTDMWGTAWKNTTQPGGVSIICLSCHDASIAISAYGNYKGSFVSSQDATSIATIAARAQVGTVSAGIGDLSNHHPIGFAYSTAFASDSEIANPTTVLNGTMRIKDMLFNGQMECVTCHDVHNSKNASGAEKFLWKSDTHSALCLTCHLKGTP